jgi:hypothetical protein
MASAMNVAGTDRLPGSLPRSIREDYPMEQAQIDAAIEQAFLCVKEALGIPADENLDEIKPARDIDDDEDEPPRRSYVEH